MQGLPVILKCHNLQSFDKALDISIEFKFCESDFYFLNGSINCMVASYNFGSVYIVKVTHWIYTPKAAVGVDRPMKALSVHIQKSLRNIKGKTSHRIDP